MRSIYTVLCAGAAFLSAGLVWSHSNNQDQKYVQIVAPTKFERTTAANAGMSLEFFSSDKAWGFAHDDAIQRMKRAGIKVLSVQPIEMGRGGAHEILDFPPKDSRFHNYQETMNALIGLAKDFPEMTRLKSIGKSREGRDIWALNINTNTNELRAARSAKPGMVYLGNHHAREHLSAEIPLMFAAYLLKNKDQAELGRLLATRDIWVVPMVNPDGVEYDIQTGSYKMWRKNRTRNQDGTYGVDLNRNYGFKWGTGGSSKDGSSDVFMGPQPFSEPETQAVRDFVRSKPNTKVLVSFHTFSELILYPWGHTYDKVSNDKDRAVFEKMAKTMAGWNGYKPQQSSDLYIASGDTVDWAYGELGIFAFTFELSPKSMFSGGFYPGAGVIDKVFEANLKPNLYMLNVADNPQKVLGAPGRGFLKNLSLPGFDTDFLTE
jgi:carboxypeptidase T